MPKIVWSDDFSVEHPEIDKQHRQWIKIFNNAYDQMMSHDVDTLSTIGIDAISEMLQYANMHFEFEEAHMNEIGFPDLEAHAKIHSAFRAKLEQINQDFHNDIRPLNSEIMKLIENWLMAHILSEDRKFKDHGFQGKNCP